MVTPAQLERTSVDQFQEREQLLTRTVTAFQEVGSTVRLMGSNDYGGADLFSDLDLWAVNPDGHHAEIMEAREPLFRGIGSLLLTWERPRFAPIGGIHSILLYDSAAPLPVELNIFQASQTVSDTVYHNFFSEPLFTDPAEKADFWRRYPWRAEPDDASPQAKLSHLLCVGYWTAKYLHRGELEKLDWLTERYDQAREQYVSDLPDVYGQLRHAECPAEYVHVILNGVRRVVADPPMLRALERIDSAAWMFADSCTHTDKQAEL